MSGEPAFAAVPPELRALRQWLVWRFEQRAGDKKPRKVPYYASGRRRTGTQGSHEDRAALVSFDEALAAMRQSRCDGIGFAFLPGDGLIGIDIDGAIDPDTGEISERAMAIIEACASYTEYSPSGRGVHIYVRGHTKSHKSNDIGLEIFCERQFFTVTGRAYPGAPAHVAPIDEATLRRLHATVDAARKRASPSLPAPAAAPPPKPSAAGGRARSAAEEAALAEEALAHVSPDDYHEWIRIGMALKAGLGGAGYVVWDAWSARSPKYAGPEDTARRWRGFEPSDITIGTVYALAEAAGWESPWARAEKRRQARAVPLEATNVVPLYRGGDPPAPTEGAAALPGKGGKGKKAKADKPIDWGRYDDLMEHFVLIYGTDTVFDCRQRRVIRVNALRLAFGNDTVKWWLAAARRRMILPEQLVFDPACQCGPECINLFEGMPLTPKPGRCTAILRLLNHLCSGELELIEWILRWCAYQVRHPGAKMATSIVMHGPEGSGKSLFWEEVFKPIFGEYATTIGQDQLETPQYNPWASRKMFVVADEVVSRNELRHNKGKLKRYITGPTLQIADKFVPLREEANHMNMVFLSNEHQPLQLDHWDRRYLVVWTPAKADRQLYGEVLAEIDAGGIEAFYWHLLNRVDLGEFNAHTPPIETQAKRDLIELSLNSAQLFYAEWRDGALPIPFGPCLSMDLYNAYRLWCERSGERYPLSRNKFSREIASEECPRGDKKYYRLGGERFQQALFYPAPHTRKEGQSQEEWIGEHIGYFQGGLVKMQKEWGRMPSDA